MGFRFLYSVLVFSVVGLTLIFLTKRGIYISLGNIVDTGLKAGSVSLILYTVTLIPGILGRFGLKNKFYVVLMAFRREFGIFMYLFALAHVWLVAIVPAINSNRLPQIQAFTVAGGVAVSLLFMLFVTSNDYAVQKLKQNWKKVHKLTYYALGFIFLHLILTKLSIWTLLAAILIILEVASFVYINNGLPFSKAAIKNKAQKFLKAVPQIKTKSKSGS